MTNPKLLIVDDEPFNVDYLEQELEETGCEILTAVNGQEALDRVQFALPDLILLDIMMPVMDGLTLLRHLRENPRYESLPVVMLTAGSQESVRSQALAIGADGFSEDASRAVSVAKSLLQ